MSIIKKIVLLLSLATAVIANDIVVYSNEYNVLELEKKVKKLVIGNRDMVNVSVLNSSSSKNTILKIFGKKSGNTSILVMYKDGSIQNYHVYVNENLGFIQKMINIIEPNIQLSKVGDGSTIIKGAFENPHDKKRVYNLLESAGIDIKKMMDLTQTNTVDKMIRTKLYLVQIDNNKAKELGGVTGMNFFSKYVNTSLNAASATNSATFSGWLLDNTGAFSASTGKSVTGTLNFLETAGIGTILDDTVLMSTEDKNASFRVGGEVYIPIGLTQNVGFAPTIRVEEREYGLNLMLKSKFMEKDGFMHINVDIKDSEFDPNKEHDVQLGEDIFVPSFVSKNIKTNVVVQSGQVIVLGGRLHSEEVKKQEKIPLLGDIPVLGKLFTYDNTALKNNDLLFFLVPEIVDANDKIDDTHFYRDFKNSSNELHKNILDLNSTKKESLIVLSDTNVTASKTHTQESQLTDEVIIEVEDETQIIESEINHVIVVEEEPLVLNKEDNSESLEKFNLQETQSSLTYKVSAPKIFLRSEPLSGKRVDVWNKGHRFTTKEEKTINNSTWLKVKEDCLQECKAPVEELWIFKKYVELL